MSVYKPSAGSKPSFTFDLGDCEVITAAFDICSSKPSINTLYFMTKDQVEIIHIDIIKTDCSNVLYFDFMGHSTGKTSVIAWKVDLAPKHT